MPPPGPVLGRLAIGDVLVPFRGAEEMGIEVDDHAPVIKQGMQDQGAGGEFGIGGVHDGDYNIPGRNRPMLSWRRVLCDVFQPMNAESHKLNEFGP